MSSQQLNDLGPEELVQHTNNILTSAIAAQVLTIAVASEAVAAVFREKVTMANRRAAHRNVVVALETEEAYYRAAAVMARAAAERVKAATAETAERERVKASRDSFDIFLHLNKLEWGMLLDASELAQASDFNINKLIDEATDAYARYKIASKKRRLAENAYDTARTSVWWARRLVNEQEPEEMERYPLSPGRMARIMKIIKDSRIAALAILDILHREQLMGEWSDEVINAEVAERIDKAGKFIKQRTRKNSKKTKRRRQKIAKRVRGTKRRK